ncbi:MAG: Mrp/NBP35 family ATP-binding protein [Sulfolobales archaeon]|nr:Mrp/NBP35 family ATP-binding protein [Sulfolobales archaeon]MDW8083539.1 Mrp/NBP35 family ATP-binding protein [Sulfolobales archaeon]
MRVNIPPVSQRDTLDTKIKKVFESIGYRIAVLSGKGGVGKSLIASYTAVALSRRGFKVGLLDLDFHGPSSHLFLGLRSRRPAVSFSGIEPVEGPLGVKVMSIAFLTPDEETPIIWRGPMKSSAIIQLLTEVNWGSLDFLVIDMPPGTGDEALTLAQTVKYVDGVLIVTIPSTIALGVVVRAINFAKLVGMKPLGIVENMSYFYCPETEAKYSIFGNSSAELISKKFRIPIVAKIPVDPELQTHIENNNILLLKKPDSPLAKAFDELVDNLLNILNSRKHSENTSNSS